MGYNPYYPHDLTAFDEKLGEASALVDKLRTSLEARQPALMYLNSFGTAKLKLTELLENLEKCPGQIKTGDKYMARVKARGKAAGKKKPAGGGGSK